MTQHSALSTRRRRSSGAQAAQHSGKLLFFVAIASLVITAAGCPTPPSSVRGEAGDAAPGELIEWPARQVDPTGEDTAGFNQVISAD